VAHYPIPINVVEWSSSLKRFDAVAQHWIGDDGPRPDTQKIILVALGGEHIGISVGSTYSATRTLIFSGVRFASLQLRVILD
jgi:hypothetical protein